MKRPLAVFAFAALLTFSSGRAHADLLVVDEPVGRQPDRLSAMPLEPTDIAVIGGFVAARSNHPAAEDQAVALGVWSIRHPGYGFDPAIEGSVPNAFAASDRPISGVTVRDVSRALHPASFGVAVLAVAAIAGWFGMRAQASMARARPRSPRARMM